MCNRVEQQNNVIITFGVNHDVIKYVEGRKGTLHYGMGTVKASIPLRNKPTVLPTGKRPLDGPTLSEASGAPKRAKRQRHRRRKPAGPMSATAATTVDLTTSPMDTAAANALNMSSLSLDSPIKYGENPGNLASHLPSTSAGVSNETQLE